MKTPKQLIKPLLPHIRNVSNNDFTLPEAILFSDQVVLKQNTSTGRLISIFARQKNIAIPAAQLEEKWQLATEKQTASTPMYTPGTPLTPAAYKLWIREAVEATLHPFVEYGSPLRDDLVRDDIAYRLYRSLIDSRSYFVENGVKNLIKKLQVAKVPFGLVANGPPQFESILAEVNARLKTDKPLLSIPGGNLVPFANAADTGIAKPDPRIFLELLRKMDLKTPENIYYIGTDPLLDYAPLETLGIRSVLLTSGLETPRTDLKYLSPRLCREKRSFRIANIQEIERVILPKEIYKKAWAYRKKASNWWNIPKSMI